MARPRHETSAGPAAGRSAARDARGLALSRHAALRARQRGYRVRDLELVAEFGTATQDGALLTRRDVEQIRGEVARTLARLERLAGTAVVVRDDTLVSAYRVTRSQRRRMLELVA